MVNYEYSLNFIDNTGHVFTLLAYSLPPVSYEYEVGSYVFWFDNEYTNKLSINNYYIKPIRILLRGVKQETKVKNIKIIIENSNIFKLIGSKQIQENFKIHDLQLNETEESGYFNYITDTLTKDDLVILEGLYEDADDVVSNNLSLAWNSSNGGLLEWNTIIPFYGIACCDDEGTWTSNILIEIETEAGDHIYCPITIGGEFVDEYEELTINGKNLGVNLPKDIIRSVYLNSFYNDEFNVSLYNQKLKEYLLNYMDIRGECGNFRSAINSLKWFGYTDKITISKLLLTDNEFCALYVNDYFDIFDDIIPAYKYFRNSALISLKMKENQETDETNPFDFDADLWGEGKPIMENLFEKTIEVSHNEDYPLIFTRQYYDYVFDELALKLLALSYYYERYFLPVHLNIESCSLTHRVYANDIKMINNCCINVTEKNSYSIDFNVNVKFPISNIVYFYDLKHYIDSNYNEFETYQSEEYCEQNHLFYVDETCANIPIKFSGAELYNCKIIISLNNDVLFENNFIFSETEEYKNLVLFPKHWIKGFDDILDKELVLLLLVNGNWFEYKFIPKMPDFNIKIGKLIYKYNNLAFRQVKEFDGNTAIFNTSIYEPDFVTVNNSGFWPEILDAEFNNNMESYVKNYRDTLNLYKNYRYLNRAHRFKFVKQPSSINYKNIFNDSCGPKINNPMISQNYDIYVMHDADDVWYVMLISKLTILNDQYDLRESNYYDLTNLTFVFPDLGEYGQVKWESSDDRFLINRMMILPNDNNTFDINDIIACYLYNNDSLYYRLIPDRCKWTITPMSLEMDNTTPVTGKSELCIVSLGYENFYFEPGYYTIKMNYSLDNEHTDYITKEAIFRIKKSNKIKIKNIFERSILFDYSIPNNISPEYKMWFEILTENIFKRIPISYKDGLKQITFDIDEESTEDENTLIKGAIVISGIRHNKDYALEEFADDNSIEFDGYIASKKDVDVMNPNVILVYEDGTEENSRYLVKGISYTGQVLIPGTIKPPKFEKVTYTGQVLIPGTVKPRPNQVQSNGGGSDIGIDTNPNTEYIKYIGQIKVPGSVNGYTVTGKYESNQPNIGIDTNATFDGIRYSGLVKVPGTVLPQSGTVKSAGSTQNIGIDTNATFDGIKYTGQVKIPGTVQPQSETIKSVDKNTESWQKGAIDTDVKYEGVKYTGMVKIPGTVKNDDGTYTDAEGNMYKDIVAFVNRFYERISVPGRITDIICIK